MLRNRDTLPPDQKQALEDLIEANRLLYAAYEVMRDMACGYRDEAYFFLKIRAAFPGVWR